VLGGMPWIAFWKDKMIKTFSELDSTGPRQYGHRQLLCHTKTCYAKVFSSVIILFCFIMSYLFCLQCSIFLNIFFLFHEQHLIDTGNDASSSVANSEFKLKLDECCGGQLPECLKNDICKLMNTFMQKSIGSANLDVSLIGDALDEMRSTISRILNQFRSVDSAVQRLVLEVLELVHGFNNRAGNDDSIRLEVSKDTSAYDHHANTSAGQVSIGFLFIIHLHVFFQLIYIFL